MKIIEHVKLTDEEYDIVTNNYDPKPCITCKIAIENGSCGSCDKCNERWEWFKQFLTMPVELRGLALEYNEIHTLDDKIAKIEAELAEAKKQRDDVAKKFFDKVIHDTSPSDEPGK